jgi:hypothetical protein
VTTEEHLHFPLEQEIWHSQLDGLSGGAGRQTGSNGTSEKVRESWVGTDKVEEISHEEIERQVAIRYRFGIRVILGIRVKERTKKVREGRHEERWIILITKAIIQVQIAIAIGVVKDSNILLSLSQSRIIRPLQRVQERKEQLVERRLHLLVRRNRGLREEELQRVLAEDIRSIEKSVEESEFGLLETSGNGLKG